MGGSGGGNHAYDRPRCQQGALRSRWQESPPQTSATSRPPSEAGEQDWGASGRDGRTLGALLPVGGHHCHPLRRGGRGSGRMVPSCAAGLPWQPQAEQLGSKSR